MVVYGGLGVAIAHQQIYLINEILNLCSYFYLNKNPPLSGLSFDNYRTYARCDPKADYCVAVIHELPLLSRSFCVSPELYQLKKHDSCIRMSGETPLLTTQLPLLETEGSTQRTYVNIAVIVVMLRIEDHQ